MLLPLKIETEIQKFPAFTYLIIAANAFVFLSMVFLPQSVRELSYYDHGFTPDDLDPLALFTSMFIHAGWLHIIGNMYFLWIFGRAVEERLNRSLYALVYLASGIAGAFLQAALTPEYFGDIPCIGASAAISGILGAYAMLYPWEEVNCLYFSFSMRYATTISLSAIWVLGSWFIFQFVNVLWLSPQAADVSVAYWAHIGGFLFGAGGAALVKYFAALAGLLRRRSAMLALEEYSDLLHKQKMDEAMEKLEAAFEAQPTDPLTLSEMGRLELSQKKRSTARKLLRRALTNAIKQKEDAKAVAAYYALVAARQPPPDNRQSLVIGRRFAKLGKHGHALGIMGEAFRADPTGREFDLEGLDKLLYEIAELLAGPLKDPSRAAAAYGLIKEFFPHSPRGLDAEYQLRKMKASGKA